MTLAGWRDVPSFAGSHRAHSACTRELVRLADGVEARVDELHTSGQYEASTTRQSPGRCIVQLGPVGLTLTWLRSPLGHVSDGELLVVVWRGMVAPSRKHAPERPTGAPATFATAIWEDTLSVEADSEATWTWRSTVADRAAYTSDALADRCIAELRRAHDETPMPAAAVSTTPGSTE